jgi:hypothetical protein
MTCPVCKQAITSNDKGLILPHQGKEDYRGRKDICYGSYMPMPKVIPQKGYGDDLLGMPIEELEVPIIRTQQNGWFNG